MASGRVRTVSVRVTAEVSDLEKKLRSVQKTLSKTGEKFKSVGAGLTKSVTVPILAVGTGLFALVQSTANAGDAIQKMALRTGISTEALSEFKHAAELSGSSIDDVEKSVKRMQKMLFDAEKGLSTSKDALAALNMTFEDLEELSPEEQFNKLSMAIADIESPSKRAALAQEIFGRAGTSLLPMLAQGSKGLAEMRQEAQDLGIVFDQDAADASAKFNDDLDRLKKGVTGVFQELAKSLLPVLVDDLIPAIKNNIIPLAKSFAERLSNLVSWFKDLSPMVQKTIGVVAGLAFALGPLLFGIGVGIKVLGTMITVVKSLGIALQFLAMNPIGLIITGIGLLVAAGIYMYKNWDTVRINFLKIFDAMALGAQTAMSWIKIKVLQGIDLILAGYEKLYGFIPGLGDLISTARSKISNLIDEEKVKQSARVMESAMKQASYAVQLQEIKLKKLEGANEDTTKAVQELAEAKEYETEVMNKSAKATEDAAEAQKRLREANIKTLDTLGGAVIKALRDRYTNEEKLQTKSLTKQSNALKRATEDNLRQYNKEYLAKLKVFNAETDAELIALQKQIDAIDGKTDAEEKALKEQEYQTRLIAKQKELSEAESAEEKLKITTELNTMIADRQREHLLESRAAEKESLRLQMDEVRNNAELKREAMKLELDEKILHEQELSDAKLKSLDDEMESVKNHFADLTTEEALQAEARLLVLDKNNQEIIDLLETYNPEWQNAGQSFGESLLEGLNSKKQSIQSAVNDIMSLVKSAQSAVVPAPSPAQSGGGEKAKSYIVKAGDTLSAIASRLGSSVAKIAGASGVKNVDLIHPGQRLTIPKLATGTNFVPQDMLAMLHKGEAVVPKEFNSQGGSNGNNTYQFHFDGRMLAEVTAPHTIKIIRQKTGFVF